MPTPKRRICFLTGTRAEFGLMVPTLRAIQSHRRLSLQILATGMHLDASRGRTINEVRAAFPKDTTTVPWPSGPSLASSTGAAIAGISRALLRLKPDVVLVTGDRVEAFAGATAAHLSNVPVAHVHGGDRALGLVDDALRHAITKLAHLHFPATEQSADRIKKLGEDPWRIHRVGSPGLDGIKEEAVSRAKLRAAYPELRPGRFALLVLHPASTDVRLEERRARILLDAAVASDVPHTVIIYPNNDPGSAGIVKVWRELERARLDRITLERSVSREVFLGLMRDAAFMLGNSSAGIIEAASFGTPVIDVGPRQLGRERSLNVLNLNEYEPRLLRAAINVLWNDGRPKRSGHRNIYGSGNAGQQIAKVLATADLDERLRHKLIAY